MSIADGSEQVVDLPPLSPYADIDEIRLHLIRLQQWLRAREPIAAGSVLTKFVTNGALVSRGILSFSGETEGAGNAGFDPNEDLLGVGGGLNGADAPLVTLTSTGQVFIKPADGGAIAPTSVTITATTQNVPGPTYQWLVDGVVDGAATTSTYVVNSFTPPASKLIRCNVTGSNAVTVFDVMSIFSLQEGSDALAAGLENENQTIQCSYLGTPVAGSFPVVSKMVVARGATFLAAPDVTFSVVQSTGIESAGTTIGASANVSIDSAGNISIGQITSNYAEAVFRATVGSATIDKVLTLNKSINGGDGSSAQTLVLTATGFAFIFPDMLATTASSPDQIDFTAALQNTSGAVTWAATGYDIDDVSTGAVSLTLQTATTCRLTKSNFVDGQGTTVRYVKVTATLGALSDTMTIYRGDNGSNAVQAVLSNEAHTLQANSGGTVSDYSGSGTTIRVYEGTTELVFDDVGAGDGTWRVSHVNSGISVGTKTDSGNYVTYGNASNMTANQATLTFTIQGKSLNGNSFTIVKVQSFAKSVAGVDGADGGDGNDGARGSLILYSSSVSPAINLSGTTWPLDTSSPFGTNDNNALKIVWQALGNSAASWVSNTVSHMRIGDTVTLTNAAGDTSITKYWTGSYWADPGTVISGNLLVGGTISGGVNLSITGSASFEGANGISVPAPGGASPNVAYDVAMVSNSTLVQDIAIYGKSSSVAAIYGHNTSTTVSRVAVYGFGPIGVYGYASVAGGNGVNGQGGGNSGTAGVWGQNSGSGDGVRAEYTGFGGGNALRVVGLSTFSGQITSTLATGTAPFAVTSTTEVANLNVAQLKGKTWAAPDPIGSTTPSTGRFTTLRVDATPTASGANVATFSGLLPTGSVASTNSWMPINLNGTQYWLPAWVD